MNIRSPEIPREHVVRSEHYPYLPYSGIWIEFPPCPPSCASPLESLSMRKGSLVIYHLLTPDYDIPERIKIKFFDDPKIEHSVNFRHAESTPFERNTRYDLKFHGAIFGNATWNEKMRVQITDPTMPIGILLYAGDLLYAKVAVPGGRELLAIKDNDLKGPRPNATIYSFSEKISYRIWSFETLWSLRRNGIDVCRVHLLPRVPAAGTPRKT